MTSTVKLTVSQRCELEDAARASGYNTDCWLMTDDYDGRAIAGLAKKGLVGITTSRKQFFVNAAGIEQARTYSVVDEFDKVN